jgi:hypothetical protein
MLSQEALKSALPLASVLDEAGVFLTPIPATPLEALVQTTRSDEKFVINNGADMTPDLENIEYIANAKDPVLGFAPHDAALDDIVEVATRAVQGHILFAKSVVSPVVAELAETTAATIEQLQGSSLIGMEVEVWTAPAPLTNSSLESSVRKFGEVSPDSPVLNMRLPDVSMEELMKIMGTGGAGLDGDVQTWASTKGDAFFMNLWGDIFQQRQAALNDRISKTFRDYLEDRECGVDYALAIFLIARRLFEQPLEGTEMDLRQHENGMVDFRNQAANRLCRAIDQLDNDKKRGMLVRAVVGRKTIVNGDVYRDWIENGGENEVLFGNLLGDTIGYTVAQISDRAQALKSLWSRHVALTQTVESNKKFSRTKEVLAKQFACQLVAATNEVDGVNLDKNAIQRSFNDMLDQVREDELGDLYGLCLRLVCRSRFSHTDAERILSGIERIKKENPSIEVREAAAVSVIEYIAYWLCSQFRVNVR